MLFYLGTHHPHWVGKAGVPLFVSRRQMMRYKRLPVAIAPWALDSGGFTELSTHGAWQTSASTYVADVARCAAEVGHLAWAAPQDWMCEPWIVEKTGKSVREHQARTIASVLELRALAPSLPFVPVLQGWERADYVRHVEDYDRAGIDLRTEPTVGLGSVCRRQKVGVAEDIVRELAGMGLRLHGFGFKITGLRACADALASADSLAWSFDARQPWTPPLPGCTHKKCSNCIKFALQWRERVAAIEVRQTRLPWAS